MFSEKSGSEEDHVVDTLRSRYFHRANKALCIVVILAVGAFYYGLYYTEISYADTAFCGVYNNKIWGVAIVLTLIGFDWSFYRKLSKAERKDAYPVFLITAFIMGGGTSTLFVARIYHLCTIG